MTDSQISHKLPLAATIFWVGFGALFFVARMDPTSLDSMGINLGKYVVFSIAMVATFLSTAAVRERVGV